MVNEFYLNKAITITGSNGFVGKTYLEKILFELEGFKKINLFFRKQKFVSIEARFKESIAKSNVFSRLKEKIQKFDDDFISWLLQRIDLYEVDYNKKNLGISSENLQNIFKEENVFIHIAASVNWDDPMEVCLNNNLLSTIQLLEMIKNNQNIKSDFVYLSSALIFGKVVGTCSEKLLVDNCTTDNYFNRCIHQLKNIPFDYFMKLQKSLIQYRKDLLKKIKLLRLYKVYLEGGKWNILANTSDDYKIYLINSEECEKFNTIIKDATFWNHYWENIHIKGMFKFMIKS